MISSGLLKHKIDIFRSTITKNSYGEDVEELTMVRSTRARVISNGASRTTENGEIYLPEGKTFVVRYYNNVQDYDIIKYNNSNYRITRIDRNEDQRTITITTEIINN